MTDELRLPVASEADLALVAGHVARALRAARASDEECARVVTAVMELARNILKYARRGEVRFGVEPRGRQVRCWIEAVDDGPGIADVAQALSDHFSTGGTLGLGLPGVRRLMDQVAIDSAPGRGTRVRAERTFTP
jgi:serine/threonine-protein kinase RsbT